MADDHVGRTEQFVGTRFVPPAEWLGVEDRAELAEGGDGGVVEEAQTGPVRQDDGGTGAAHASTSRMTRRSLEASSRSRPGSSCSLSTP